MGAKEIDVDSQAFDVSERPSKHELERGDLVATRDPVAEQKLLRKLDMNIITLFGALYLMSFLGKLDALSPREILTTDNEQIDQTSEMQISQASALTYASLTINTAPPSPWSTQHTSSSSLSGRYY